MVVATTTIFCCGCHNHDIWFPATRCPSRVDRIRYGASSSVVTRCAARQEPAVRLDVRRCFVVADLIRAVLAAAAVLPGYFWAAVLRPTSGLGERLAYSTAVSMASVPVIAVVIARAAGSGVTLWVALAAVLIVFGAGALAYRVKGPAPGSASPLLPLPAPVRDPRVLALVGGALALALVMMADR